jgi:formylglycine-generating enzyme required for sulfatase activity
LSNPDFLHLSINLTLQGLMDMAGNVWEWMGNYFDKKEDFFALRGGSWDGDVTHLRCSARDCLLPDYGWLSVIGFRVCRAFVPGL